MNSALIFSDSSVINLIHTSFKRLKIWFIYLNY